MEAALRRLEELEPYVAEYEQLMQMAAALREPPPMGESTGSAEFELLMAECSQLKRVVQVLAEPRAQNGNPTVDWRTASRASPRPASWAAG